MFSRLKGAIDSRIAEEQARQRQAQLSAQGRPPARRRPQNPNGPAQRPSSRPRDGPAGSNERQPDPGEFVIVDEEGLVTPVVEKANPVAKAAEDEGQKQENNPEQEVAKEERTARAADTQPAAADDMRTSSEQPLDLPVDVRTKLRKLEKLESRYGELLKAYRTAHARIQTIEPFESSLRENTPLTSINDPLALVEYLNQVKQKGDMVLSELRRVTTERDEFKKKFEQSEKDSAALKTKVEDLEAKANAVVESKQERDADNGRPGSTENQTEDTTAKDPIADDSEVKTPPASRMGSFSLFSPKFGANKEPAKDTSEDLFSYDSEVPRLEQELAERTEEVTELNRQLTVMKADLAVARESTSSMVQSLESATQELNALRDEKEKFETNKSSLEQRIAKLEAESKSESSEAEQLRNQMKDFEAQRDEASSEIKRLSEQITELQKSKLDLLSELEMARASSGIINEKLSQKDAIVKDLEDSLAAAKLSQQEQAEKSEPSQSSEKKLATMQRLMDNLRGKLNAAEKTVSELKKDIQAKEDEFASKPSTKLFGLLGDRNDQEIHKLKSRNDAIDFLATNYGLKKDAPAATQTTSSVPAEATNGTTGSKKKNKKKKKGGKGQPTTTDDAEPEGPVKVSEDLNEIDEDGSTTPVSSNTSVKALEQQVSDLKKEIDEKNASIDKLSKQIKDQEALKEEIETLRDDLLLQGQEHVEARDSLKQAQEARRSLEMRVEELERELQSSKNQIDANSISEKAHQDLNTQFEELKDKAASLQKDLSAAESLATARFKDISDLKELLSKAQPELRQLRSENADLKSVKDNLKNKEGELKRLEGRHEDLKSEMKGLSKRLGDKDTEIKELQTKVEQETKARNKVENDLSSAQLDARVAENKRKDTADVLEQRKKELAQAKEEAASLRKKVSELEDKVSEHSKDILSLKEEVTLKTALHSSSQSLLQSLRDQAHELSMQARESTTRAESLEEELAEAQRMLTDRTRESQTMRMHLDQAQNGVETRIREWKERADAAVEERDRIEDEANVRDRRMMREVEDARNKMRDAQKQLKILEDDCDDLETKSRDWRRSRDQLEKQAEDAKRDVDDVKQAMKGLREALDESERQIRESETQKADLRRQADETNERVDKLTKANQTLSEELKKLQEATLRKSLRPVGTTDGGLRSSRTSIDSTRSPAPPLVRESSVSTQRSETPTGQRNASNVGLSQGTVDYVYLKNVLLQFIEQKDKSHQRQLIPVLGMLLHFDPKDEQKWIAAISTK